MCKKLLLLALLASLAPGEAQVMTAGGYAPQGFSKLAVQSPRSVVQLPPLNNFALLQAAKSEELVRPGPFKFGEAVPVALNMRAGHGEWTVDHINQRRIWRAMVKSPGAVSLSILFSRFYLPPDSEFYVLSRTGQRLGAFTAAVNNKEDGKFATAPLAGDLLLLEYNEPLGYQGNALVRRAEIRIHKVVHGFRKTILDADSSGRCNIDVMCSEGDGKRDQIDAVGMMITADGQRFCSGSLVNNVRQDGKQYFLTAHHCIFSDVSYFMVGFNYQWNYCRSSTNSTSLQGIPSPQLAQGMQLISMWEPSDYALLLIKESIPSNYNVFMAGWDTSSQAATNVYGIHHPSGDVKKVSLFSGRLAPASWGEAPKRYHWEVPHWTRGVTEPGSSGSPLFNFKGQVIGHLHGGQSSCDYPMGYDMYGAFSSDWTAPPSINLKLGNWLNPTKIPIGNLAGSRLNDLRARPHIDLRVASLSNSPSTSPLLVSSQSAGAREPAPKAASSSSPSKSPLKNNNYILNVHENQRYFLEAENRQGEINALPSLPLMNPK